MERKENLKPNPPTVEQAFRELEEWWPNGFEEDIQRLMAFRLISLRQRPDDAAAIVGKYDLMKIVEKFKRLDSKKEN